jgi:ABC-2 type transport system permease protein
MTATPSHAESETFLGEVQARLRLKWLILRTAIEERLTYRADFAFSTLVRFLPIVTQIFLWGAIFQNAAGRSIQGYNFSEMVSYFLLVMLTRAFSSMPGLSTGIASSIADGSVRKYLIQPVDMLDHLFWHRIAHKLVYYAVATGPFALVFWLCREHLPSWPGWPVMLAFAASLLMAFAIGFLIESLIGLIAFWFLEVSSLIFIYMMLSYFLSGHMIPLELLSKWIPFVDYLPFRYLAYTPTAILIGKIPREHLPIELLIQAGWIAGLFTLNRYVFHRGVLRYSAFGG